MNTRGWTARASEKIGILRPRERAAFEYGEKLKDKAKDFDTPSIFLFSQLKLMTFRERVNNTPESYSYDTCEFMKIMHFHNVICSDMFM